MSKVCVYSTLIEKENGKIVRGIISCRSKQWKHYKSVEVSMHLLHIFEQYAHRCGNYNYMPKNMVKHGKRDVCLCIDHVHETVYTYYYDTNKLSDIIGIDTRKTILNKFFAKREKEVA